jgi:hypothetical protein
MGKILTGLPRSRKLPACLLTVAFDEPRFAFYDLLLKVRDTPEFQILHGMFRSEVCVGLKKNTIGI